MKFQSLFLENDFINFTPQHYLPIVIIIGFGLCISIYARRHLDSHQQKITGTALALISFLGIFSKTAFNIYEGFIWTEDLPLYVCNILALFAPFLMWNKNRFWLGITYFWIIAGTLNANITPDMKFGFPHWIYFSYWLMHAGLLILPLYSVLVYRIKIKFKDLTNAFLMANGFLICSLLFNYVLGSNYMYTMAKPPSATILDYLGPWPYYLISVQFLALVLFFIAYFPFVFSRSASK